MNLWLLIIALNNHIETFSQLKARKEFNISLTFFKIQLTWDFISYQKKSIKFIEKIVGQVTIMWWNKQFNHIELTHYFWRLGGSSTPSSCKYATLSEKGLGSPQDLSLTTSSSMTPHGVAVAAVTTPSSTPSTRHESSGKSNKSSNSHRHSSSKSSNHQSVVAAPSPSSVSSVSSGSQSDPQSPGGHGDESNSKNANAPQIYPWMKRVHLGQSKSIKMHLYYIFRFISKL